MKSGNYTLISANFGQGDYSD